MIADIYQNNYIRIRMKIEKLTGEIHFGIINILVTVNKNLFLYHFRDSL